MESACSCDVALAAAAAPTGPPSPAAGTATTCSSVKPWVRAACAACAYACAGEADGHDSSSRVRAGSGGSFAPLERLSAYASSRGEAAAA